MCIVTYQCHESNAFYDSMETGQLETPHLQFAQNAPCISSLFQFLTHWVRASVPTVGHVRAWMTMGPVTMENLADEVVLTVKGRYTCLSFILCLVSPPEV